MERDVNDRLVAAIDRGDPVTLTVDSLARLFVGGLMLPPIAKVMGSVLYGLSTYSPVLRAVLGVQPHLPRVIDWPFGLGRVLLPKTSYRD